MVNEACTEIKPGRLSELYLKKELENILQSRIPSTYTLYLAMFFINWNKIYNNNSIFSCTSCASLVFRNLPTNQTIVWYMEVVEIIN